MGCFKFTETGFEGLSIIEPEIYEDDRGCFMEIYNYNDFKNGGIDRIFVQENRSVSKRGVLRGMHYQKSHPQGKLVRVVSGAVFDVVIDIRKDSPTFKKWFGIKLSSENRKMLYIPEGFAHGFYVLADNTMLEYKCTDFYYPGDEGIIAWNHAEIGIRWPFSKDGKVILSPKDKAAENREWGD